MSGESESEVRMHPQHQAHSARISLSLPPVEGEDGHDSQPEAAASEIEIKQEFIAPFSDGGVPRRKRSDLGVVIVRICPGFAIRDLPRMYKEFKRAKFDMDRVRQRKGDWPVVSRPFCQVFSSGGF